MAREGQARAGGVSCPLTASAASGVIRIMRRVIQSLAIPLAVFASLTSLSTGASADVPPEPKCKCSTLGAPARGGVVVASLGFSGLLVLAVRRRRR
jgi:MYXO-CTERM domain-containing protein